MNEEDFADEESATEDFFFELLLLIVLFGGGDALRAWSRRAKVVLPQSYYDTLEKLSSEPSRVATIAADTAMLSQMAGILNDAFANRHRFEAWLDDVRSGAVSVGLPGHKVDTIIRNNLQAGYATGRGVFQRLDRAARPFLRYDAINDERTRPAHAAMDGFVAEADSAVWLDWTPPCGFNCRCRVVALTPTQALAYRKLDAAALASDPQKRASRYSALTSGPDPGWGRGVANPAEAGVMSARESLLKVIDEKLRDSARPFY